MPNSNPGPQPQKSGALRMSHHILVITILQATTDPNYIELKLASDLVGVHENDLLEAEREEDVKEEDLVSPDGALLLALLVQPARPLVLHVLVLKPVALGVLRDEILDRYVLLRLSTGICYRTYCTM